MLLAELEVWHSRPYAPTRRVALGHLVLPADPAPGFGGVLLGAVVAANVEAVTDDNEADLHRLILQVERAERVVQPRLRHRFQVDRHGLAHSVHRLVGEGENLTFEFERHGSPLQQVLGAIYATERLAIPSRHGVAAALLKGLRWRGPIGPELIAHLAGPSASFNSLLDPKAWAFEVLGFPQGTAEAAKKEVMAKYRDRLREVHPDHGGDQTTASQAIVELSEARRILLA
ncbi:MAG: J domain-containing protein [Ilumatobacteraceae bacterium]